MFQLCGWKFIQLLSDTGAQYCSNFNSMQCFNLKLYLVEVGKLDEHGSQIQSHTLQCNK